MGRKNKTNRRISKNRDFSYEELVYKDPEEQEKIEKQEVVEETEELEKIEKLEEKETNFKDAIKVKNFSNRRKAQQAEKERKDNYLRAVGKIQQSEER